MGAGNDSGCLISSEGMGSDGLSNRVRYSHQHTPGERPHLPKCDGGSSNLIKFRHLLFIYHSLQPSIILVPLISVENLTEEFELAI